MEGAYAATGPPYFQVLRTCAQILLSSEPGLAIAPAVTSAPAHFPVVPGRQAGGPAKDAREVGLRAKAGVEGDLRERGLVRRQHGLRRLDAQIGHVAVR